MNRYSYWSLKNLAVALVLVATGCASTTSTDSSSPGLGSEQQEEYVIGPGDRLKISVWRNPDASVDVPVRPDGKISSPLVEEVQAAGKTPKELARDIESALSTYIKNPIVTVIVTNFVGTFDQQIRVLGQAAQPQALAYKDSMTLLDVMITVGGLSQFAAGNRAKVIRTVDGTQSEIPVRLDDLINKGDITANISMLPGDVLIIPESLF